MTRKSQNSFLNTGQSGLSDKNIRYVIVALKKTKCTNTVGREIREIVHISRISIFSKNLNPIQF